MIESYEYYFRKYNGRKHIEFSIETGFIWMSDTRVSFYKSLPDGEVLHRLDGPAIFHKSGSIDWVFDGLWKAGTQFSWNDLGYEWHGPFYDWTVEHGMNIENLTDEDKVLIKMVWA